MGVVGRRVEGMGMNCGTKILNDQPFYLLLVQCSFSSIFSYYSPYMRGRKTQFCPLVLYRDSVQERHARCISSECSFI